MGELQTIETNYPQIKTWNGQRVVTFKDIDEVHERKSGSASRNFTNNRKHFIEGQDYYIAMQEQVDKQSFTQKNFPSKIPNAGLTLLTETGYLMIVKSFKDDLSWAVQRELVNNYFRVRSPEPQIPEKLEEDEFRTAVQRKRKEKPSFYEENNTKMEVICKRFGLTRRELLHKMYNYIGEVYDFERVNEVYEDIHGKKPDYTMDLLDEFPPLWNMGEHFLIGIFREIKH